MRKQSLLIIPAVIYRFGAFTLDTDRYELRQAGETLPAEPKVLEVLAYLVEERHRVVTKDELVEKVWGGQFVSDSAVSRAIRETRRLLGDTAAESRWIKTVYGRGFAFAGGIVPADREEVATGAQGRRVAPLPSPLTSLIGRRRELEAVCELLTGARLVTLTGTGGAGKTRLALEAARESAGRFADGAVLVPLGEISEGERVAGAIALALRCGDAAGDSASEAIRRSIGDQQLLLVLDNFEQVVEAGVFVADLLRGCPNLTVLVTSRFVLQVEGEREYPVQPLALPKSDAAETTLEEAPSVALFLDRARAVRHDFRPQGKDLAYVAEICRRLDGLPLAIELAAARIKVLSPHELWQRLAGSLDLLSVPSGDRPQRHQTLQLALDWSHELLEEAERALLGRLAVFAGGFSLSAVAEVCRMGDESVVDLITALVDKSLVSRLPSLAGTSRFGLLETTRAFAWDHLQQAGEAVELQTAHAAWVLDLVRRGEEHLAGGNQESWLKRLDAERGNLLAALTWARSGGDVETGLATGAALARYWSARGRYREGRQEIEALLVDAEQGTVDPAVRADALMALGMLCLLLCDYAAAAETLNQALTIVRPLGDRQRLAETLNHQGWVLAQGRNVDRAEAISREALALHQELGNARGVGVALNNLGWLALYQGDAAAAEEYFGRGLNERRAAADERGAAFALINLAILRLHLTEQWGEVEPWLDEAQTLVERLGDRPLREWALCARGALAGRRGAAEEAIAVLGEYIEITDDAGSPDGRAWGLLFLGEVLAARGESLAARCRFEECREIWEDLDMPWGVAQAERRLADLEREEDGS